MSLKDLGTNITFRGLVGDWYQNLHANDSKQTDMAISRNENETFMVLISDRFHALVFHREKKGLVKGGASSLCIFSWKWMDG